MNDKFKMLALQAKMGTADFDVGSYYVATPDKMQKFGELIVQECVNILEGMSPGYQDYRDQIEDAFRKDCVAEIKHKFRIEESLKDSNELHTCPYREEIHNDYDSLCDCDEEQTHQCAMDI